MPNVITDGDFTVASPVSDLRYIAPFAQYAIKDLYIVEQDFVIDRPSFSPLSIDTAHPTLAGYFLAIETPMQPVAFAGTVKWTRRYAQVPASFSRPGGNYGYTFPVIINPAGATVDTGSRLSPKTLNVEVRIQTDFIHSGDPNTVTVIPAQRFALAAYPSIDATSSFGQPVVSDATTFSILTNPSYSTYTTWVAGGIEFVAEASRITPNWMGNIHMRETIYVKAL